MTLQHVPEYGIVGKTLPLYNDESDNTATTASNISNNNIIGTSVEQVTASNLRAKKEAANDSKFAPTTQEIYSHVRYLSEEGMKLIMRDVDKCAREALRYSAVEVDGASGDGKEGGNRRMNNFRMLAEEIHDYIELFQPDRDDGEGDDTVNNKNTDIVSLGEVEQLKEILGDMIHCRNKRKYNPTLLPFITIKCYPNVLDRSEMTKVLSADLARRVNNNAGATSSHDAHPKRPSTTSSSSCVVTIRSTSNLVQQGYLIAEILSQCISNDPNGEAYAMELTRQRKRMKSQVSRIDVDEAPGGSGGVASIFTSVWSWTNSLVDWCSSVECFDSIIVLLEDIENIPSPTLDTFLTTLISLRSWHGIPISVVLMDSIPGGLGDRLSRLRSPSNHDSGAGDGGVAACELELPLPQAQFDLFVNHLFFSGKCVPSFLWTNQSLWNHTLEVFHEFDNSVMSLARYLKAELRRYFAVPGSFVTLLHCKEFVIPNECRLKWLFGEENSRTFLSIKQTSQSGGKKPTKQAEKKDGHVVDLLRKIQVSYVCHQLLQKIYTTFDLTPVREARLSSLAKRDLRVRLPKLIYTLQDARQKLSAQDANDSAVMQTKLDEYIILLSHITEEEEVGNQMANVLLEDIIYWVEGNFPLQIVLGEPFPPSTQPRRDVARALVLPPPKAVSKQCLSRATRTAFQVFQSRVMTLSDWYNKYFEVVTESKDENSSEVAFFFAVYELVHMGFVRKVVTGRRSEETYEKIAIVWGSGR